MKNLKLILLVVLIFGAGVVTGVVGTRIAVRRFVQHAITQPDLVREKIERDLTRRLQLDAAQQVKVREILNASHSRIRELRREFQPQFAGVMREASTEISALLTPEQRERFARFRAEHAELLQPK